MSTMNGASDQFTAEQQNYLQGFMLGADVARAVRGLPILSGCAGAGGPVGGAEAIQIGPSTTSGPVDIHRQAQDRFLAAGKTLVKEEQAKRDKHPCDMWEEMQGRAERNEFPQGTDVFLTKYHGLFQVAPAQNAYMCRLRIPGGVVKSWQLRGMAELAEKYAGPYADVTTRANFQFREIGAADGLNVLTGLRELGIVSLGSGADNIRNVTCGPTAGFDTQELIDTLPLAKHLHFFIQNTREMLGLPRKFNIAFDGGGTISSLEDTNDIGFAAVRVSETNATPEVPAGVWFRLTLGGITGHQDFARDTGVLVAPSETTKLSAAIVRVFIQHGDRTDRRKARLKYVLDAWGFEKFLDAVEQEYKGPLRRFPLSRCEERSEIDRYGHVGFHAQRPPGLSYVGVVLPVGRISCEQMRGIANIAERFGSSEIRLTVWQNFLIPGIRDESIGAVKQAIEDLGLHWEATNFRAGLVACTGNAGCKYAAANTKAHALRLADYLEERYELDEPLNIHLTGCHHSCAQHYIGDIGLIAAGVEVGDEMVEGYHVHVGGGFGASQGIGRELARSVAFADVPPLIGRLIEAYMEHRSFGEPFVDFIRRHEIEALRQMMNDNTVAV